MKKAVNQWCFPDGTPLKQVFEVSQAAGLDGVELNIYEPGGVGLTLETTDAEAKAIKKMAADHGLELKSLSNGLLWQSPLSAASADVRAKGVSIVRKQLELASVLEMDAILVVPGRVDKETSYEECWARSQQELAQLAPYAEQLGVKIGVENVWNKFLLSPTDMVRYIDELSYAFVGAYFDVGNVLNFGFPEQWIRSLGERIVKVHVKDFSTSVGNITGFVPLLSGDVDWKSVRQALRDVGYDDYITAELSPYKVDANQMIHDTSRQMSFIMDCD
ncbi:sugar phosphate isomerase/epimerase [Alicyclobacillus fastidiosus]|uniref:Sugar phosphate isomerase/epimerase n=1 Tax=Alicyclobacillus fastidiosus TaxID=392011 RepID=A0ABY6ZM93_9BACL|nr:sugar phosphate isomerase/epimerase family protein [Alicyclobacillus fastidiosus]WAH43966.1 sugar phosphate isomerase/epimerase [Alicyclobacillus fastidiosus]GMA60221.1 hypothetical protein GCM10025859_06610 [Alicyclobacillus fastidiosus]